MSYQEILNVATWEYKPVWLALLKVYFSGLAMSSNCPSTTDHKKVKESVDFLEGQKKLGLILLLFCQKDIFATRLFTYIAMKTEFVHLQHQKSTAMVFTKEPWGNAKRPDR